MRTLSDFLGASVSPAAPTPEWVNPVPPADMKTSLELFNVLSFVLQFCPAPASEQTVREKFAQVGIIPGKTFGTASPSPKIKAAFQAGMQLVGTRSRGMGREPSPGCDS